MAECGVGQIMIGTDYPFPRSPTTVDHVPKTPGLSDRDKRTILGETAARLLKLTWSGFALRDHGRGYVYLRAGGDDRQAGGGAHGRHTVGEGGLVPGGTPG